MKAIVVAKLLELFNMNCCAHSFIFAFFFNRIIHEIFELLALSFAISFITVSSTSHKYNLKFCAAPAHLIHPLKILIGLNSG